MICLRDKLITLICTSRPAFLILTAVYVFFAIALTVSVGHSIESLPLVLVISGSLAAHVAVNVFNEYFDFRSGLDSKTIKTRFSGGSGSLQKSPEMAASVFVFAAINLILVFLVALYFLLSHGFIILLPFIPGILMVIFYNHFIVKNPFLCLFAPGIGFGFSVVAGTNIALTGAISWKVFLVSLIPFFLVNNLLLMNQFPDLEADMSAGRRNVVIIYGKKESVRIYGIFLICTFAVIIISAILKIIPLLSLSGLVPLIISLIKVKTEKDALENHSSLTSLLGTNAFTVMFTPFLIAAGLLLDL